MNVRMEDAVRALIACVGEERFLQELAKVEDRQKVDVRETVVAVDRVQERMKNAAVG